MRKVVLQSVPVVLIALAMIAMSLAPVLLTGCGASQRQKTLRASLVAVDAALDGFDEWDERHQLTIVEQASTKEEGRAKLDAYRIEKAKLKALAQVVYRALASASLADDDASLKDVLVQVEKLISEVKALKGGP